MVFKNQKCLDCGATGDSRLMPKYCHMEPVYIHPGNIVQYHPKGILIIEFSSICTSGIKENSIIT